MPPTPSSLWGGRSTSDGTKPETLVPTELAEKALARIDQRFFRDYEIIAYLSEVQVVRGSKFAEHKRA